jgi:hypothetical protein
MSMQQGHPALSIAADRHLGSVVPGANSSLRAGRRSHYFVAWGATFNTEQFGNTGTVVPGAIVEVLHKMALLKAAVCRRYNKWQQSDSKQPAAPSVCCRCAGRYKAKVFSIRQCG